jgi:uncharacterized NAD(P)/FAD-binding protein YdhS
MIRPFDPAPPTAAITAAMRAHAALITALYEPDKTKRIETRRTVDALLHGAGFTYDAEVRCWHRYRLRHATTPTVSTRNGGLIHALDNWLARAKP